MAKQKNKKWSDYMWLVSATYFTLGFLNIVFTWLGVICFLIPLIMAIFGGGKGYCNNYCGRGQLFLQITRVRDNIQKSKEQKNIQPTKGGHNLSKSHQHLARINQR